MISEETRRKMSIVHTGSRRTIETKQKMSAWQIGKHLSEETKRKISIAHLGKPSQRHGTYCSEESKQKMSVSATGKKRPPFSTEHRKNMSIARMGQPMSESAKAKLRMHRIKLISDAEFNGAQLIPAFNPAGCKIFEQINQEMSWNGQHAENGGEFHIKELGYWVDYYEPNHNIVIEYDEHQHNSPKIKSKDMLRQTEIETYLKCQFYRLKENEDWHNLKLAVVGE